MRKGYSPELFEHIIGMSKHYASMKIKFSPELPLTIETDDFIYLVAPRADYEKWEEISSLQGGTKNGDNKADTG